MHMFLGGLAFKWLVLMIFHDFLGLVMEFPKGYGQFGIILVYLEWLITLWSGAPSMFIIIAHILNSEA